MATVEVYTGSGDKKGADIIEPLLSDNMLRIRGNAEIYAHAYQYSTVTIDAVFRGGLRLGDIVAITHNSGSIIARIVGISITVDNVLNHRLTLERVR